MSALHILLVGVGGFIGSVLRYLAGTWTQRLLHEPAWPYGTLLVNVVGCLLLGLLGGLADHGSRSELMTPGSRHLLMIGLLGGFTTFSTFGYETMSLVRQGQHGWALANVAASLILGLLAVALGYLLGAKL